MLNRILATWRDYISIDLIDIALHSDIGDSEGFLQAPYVDLGTPPQYKPTCP